MLLIPVIGKISWRNPPVITLLLILLNVMIYFGFQLGDQRAYVVAHKFYFESGLVKIEMPRYLAYRDGRPYSAAYDRKLAAMKAPAVGELLWDAIGDGDFQKQLDNETIIRPTDPDYDKWKRLRRQFLDHFEKSVSVRYGFRPSHPRPVTWVTHMFLHGGAGHLVGNMIFLWLVGCMLEYGIGRKGYPVIYLLGGLSAVSLFYLLNRNSAIPLVGASGAIAGLMGAFAVLFGRERVRLFLSLGFYFNYLRIPAIVLLPLWIGNELYQMLFGDASQVAYAAHLGGLVGGAGLGFLHKRFIGGVDLQILEDPNEDTFSPKMETALGHMGRLELAEARRVLLEILKESPDDPEVLRRLFHIDRHFPGRNAVHTTTAAYLKALGREEDHQEEMLRAYERYIDAVKKPRLSVAHYMKVSDAMIACGRPAEAERLLGLLLKAKPDLPGLPGALMRLLRAWKQAGEEKRMARLRQVILKRFPRSPEAAALRRG